MEDNRQSYIELKRQLKEKRARENGEIVTPKASFQVKNNLQTNSNLQPNPRIENLNNSQTNSTIAKSSSPTAKGVITNSNNGPQTTSMAKSSVKPPTAEKTDVNILKKPVEKTKTENTASLHRDNVNVQTGINTAKYGSQNHQTENIYYTNKYGVNSQNARNNYQTNFVQPEQIKKNNISSDEEDSNPYLISLKEEQAINQSARYKRQSFQQKPANVAPETTVTKNQQDLLLADENMAKDVKNSSKWSKRVKVISLVLLIAIIGFVGVLVYISLRPKRSITISLEIGDAVVYINGNTNSRLSIKDPYKNGDSYTYNFKMDLVLPSEGDYEIIFEIENNKNLQIDLISKDYVVTGGKINIKGAKANKKIAVLSGIELMTDSLKDIEIFLKISVVKV